MTHYVVVDGSIDNPTTSLAAKTFRTNSGPFKNKVYGLPEAKAFETIRFAVEHMTDPADYIVAVEGGKLRPLNPAEESEYQREAQVQIIRNVWNYLTTALGFIEINESAKVTERIEAALKDIDKLARYYRR
jgi:hypothetical protein